MGGGSEREGVSHIYVCAQAVGRDFTKYIDSGEDYYHQSVCKTTSHSISLGYRF